MSHRWYRAESWANIAASARLGGLGNSVARRLRESDAVLDISGGDSFSDNYTAWTFRRAVTPKRIALALRRPLILLPQTYGPFRDPALRAQASRIIRSATLAYSRDAASHQVLLDLHGDHGRHDRLLAGVDMAFALAPVDPANALPARIRDLLSMPDRDRPLVGVNINGLLYSDRYAASRFGIGFDYRAMTHRLVTWFAAQDCDVLLVPHVTVTDTKANPNEDDLRACQDLITSIGTAERRVQVLPAGLTAAQVKWAIARTSWFCGSRMHSTIASLSSGVPTAGVAYSMKMRGVFETCGVADEVIDGREVHADQCLDQLKDAWARRDAVRAVLGSTVEDVRLRAARQLDHALQVIADDEQGLVS